MKDKDKEKIKEIYQEMNEIALVNRNDVYLMPTTVYDAIISKIQYFEEALNNARKSRDIWKDRHDKLKRSQSD